MTGRRTLTVLMALCALSFSAIAAQSAAAATNGTTAYTCTSDAKTKDFKTEHCVPGETGTAFGHVEVPPGEITEAKLSNAKTDSTTTKPTNFSLHSTIGGAKFTITATGVNAEGLLENNQLGSGEHFTEAATASIELTGVTTSNPNCAVEGLPGGLGVIKTKVVGLNTKEHGMGIRLFAAVAGLIAEFRVVKSGAMVCAQAGTYPVVGTATGIPNGATIKFDETETTNSGALHIGNEAGPVVGLNGLITVTAKKKGADDATTKPISPTTVATP
ncbi:MAG TPA: hypothetical protein VMS11_02160 [Solirubrobacterales bacterium]|nr:hypothetical protein [Solirubrobacterales bacterium]